MIRSTMEPLAIGRSRAGYVPAMSGEAMPAISTLSYLRDPAASVISADHLRSVGPSALEALFSGTADCVQLTPGHLIVDRSSIATKIANVHAVSTQCGFQLRAGVPDDTVLIGMSIGHEPIRAIFNGRPFDRTSLLVISGSHGLLNVWGPSSFLWLEIDLTKRNRQPYLRPLMPKRYSAAIVRDSMPRPQLRELIAIGLLLAGAGGVETVRACWSHRHESSIERAAELLNRLPDPLTTTEMRRNNLVERVERFMWESIEEPPTLGEICAAVGCKTRTLIYAFESTFGLTPMKYFKVLRLNAVARHIVMNPGRRIFDVAADYGFWHMGHFGADYKAMFGETPKEKYRIDAANETPAGATDARDWRAEAAFATR